MSCYLPRCERDAQWKVTDVTDERAVETCGGHLPRAVARQIRRVDGSVVVAPLIDIASPLDVLPLIEVGAVVYGLVTNPAAAEAIAAMSDELRRTVSDALTSAYGRHPSVFRAEETARAALRGPLAAESEGAEVITLRPESTP